LNEVKKLWIILAMILFFIFTCTLICGEIYFRYAGTLTWFEYYSKDRLKHYKPMSEVKLNSIGLRDEEYDHPKTANIFRILILGDSFTYGYGVNNRNDLFCKIMEKRLNDEAILGSDIKIEVLNGGGENKITGDWLELFKKVIISFQPDIVVAVFTYRDAAPPKIAHITFRELQKELAQRNQQSWFYRHSAFYRFCKNSIDGYEISQRFANVCQSMFIGSKEETAEWENAKKNLITIRDLAKKNDMPFYLVIFPALIKLNENHSFFPIINIIKEFADKNGIECFSLFEAFRGQHGPSLWVSKYDQHPNEKGHKITSNALFDFLKDKIKSKQIEKDAKNKNR
jgi:lysophospholipase L1-like esterase